MISARTCASDVECRVCSIKSTTLPDRLFLYAPTEILSQRLELVLRAANLSFTSRDRTYALQWDTDRDTALDVLRSELSTPEANDVRVTGDAANLMAADTLTRFFHRNDSVWFERALVNDRFTHWFQPIVDARAETLLGHECLIRLGADDASERVYSGDDIIGAAMERGEVHTFDSYSRRTAIRNAAREHRNGRIFINFMPSSIYDPAFCMASTLAAMAGTNLVPSDIVFEVIESEKVTDPRHLHKIAQFYRDQGFGIALDDVGTGSNSLPMISDIQPDYIKLDKSIVWRCDTAIGRTTITKLAEIGAESDIAVIAEGVETAAMRDTLLECGISLMQGFYFARPAPAMHAAFPTP